ncbi:hypothetical protein [Sphingomonas sp. Leaf343]|uniref:hypothetical protein n=1 Tax=Sphingomonas sp. Leaf343 TaxID=1736345 RepID=UPI0006FD56A6|nr:hypothetical protein [Sphingomonas sp. Leaf343]KQR80954.1 hypothetical protein ASG07_14400 [Sphingomonas sp. Leaf343]
MAAILLMMFLSIVPQGPVMATFDHLPPVVAGNDALKGHGHAPIASVEVPPLQGLAIPDIAERELVEVPVAGALGCSRKRWLVKFRRQVGETAPLADGAFAVTEIAPVDGGTCPSDRYVAIRGLGIDRAFAALGYLNDVRSRRVKVKLSCRDTTGSGMCRNSRTIQASLEEYTPSAVTQVADVITLWLGARDQLRIAVSYSTSRANRISIRRDIPPPA